MEVEREMTREDLVRIECLKLANNTQESHNIVVDRAQAYSDYVNAYRKVK